MGHAVRTIGSKPGVYVPPSGRRWFVVQTHLHQERQAKRNLVAQHFEVYLPMRLGHPKSKNPISPLLPRYLFARFDPDVDQWLAIVSTVGVYDIIRGDRDGKPLHLADAALARVRSKEVDGVIHLTKKGPKAVPYKPGDKLRIVDGALAGFDAVFDARVDEHSRIAVFLSVLGRDVRTELEVSSVEGADLR